MFQYMGSKQKFVRALGDVVREIGSVTYQGFADRLTGRGEVRAVYELWSPVEVILEPVCVFV